MSAALIEDIVVIEDLIDLKIPVPEDFSLPEISATPSTEFPAAPDLEKLIADLTETLEVIAEPQPEVDIDGVPIPQANLDVEEYVSNLEVVLPEIPAAPSTEFPGAYNPEEIKTSVEETLVVVESGFIEEEVDGIKFPQPQFDADAYLAAFLVELPEIPSAPSTEFPVAPDFEIIYGDLGLAPEKYFAQENVPDTPTYDPFGPTIEVELIINGEPVE